MNNLAWLYNSRVAIRKVLLDNKIDSVIVPYFFCHDVILSIKKLSINLDFYELDSSMEPILKKKPITKKTALFVVNYFGIEIFNSIKLSKLKSRYPIVILDCAHGFRNKYVESIPETKGLFIIASNRKIFGLPFGSFLYTKGGFQPKLPRNFKWELYYIAYLFFPFRNILKETLNFLGIRKIIDTVEFKRTLLKKINEKSEITDFYSDEISYDASFATKIEKIAINLRYLFWKNSDIKKLSRNISLKSLNGSSIKGDARFFWGIPITLETNSFNIKIDEYVNKKIQFITWPNFYYQSFVSKDARNLFYKIILIKQKDYLKL